MLTISQYKEWEKYPNKTVYRKFGNYFKKFPDASRRHDRIYFDIKINNDHIDIPQGLSILLARTGFTIKDYIQGICINQKSGNMVKIGKVLRNITISDIKEKLSDIDQSHFLPMFGYVVSNRSMKLCCPEYNHSPHITFNQALDGLDLKKLLAIYSQSKNKCIKNTEELQVVISRHAYDLIGMSTDRGWTSCIDLEDKKYNKMYHSAFKDKLRAGGIVAYVIRKTDRNINRPLSRIFMEENYIDSKIRLSEIYNIYGAHLIDFHLFMRNWVNEYNKQV